MRKIAMMLLVTAAGVGFASGSAHAAEAKPEQKEQPKKHVVASGDSLSTIATANQLESWRPIWNANPEVSNPDIINVGQELVIPNGETTERPLPSGYGEPVATVAQPVKQANKTYQPAARRVAPTGGDVFARIRAKESGGNYATNTGNGYYGAYQFSLGTWRSVGGSGLPSDASPAEQDMRAQMLYNQRGCSPWPNTCY